MLKSTWACIAPSSSETKECLHFHRVNNDSSESFLFPATPVLEFPVLHLPEEFNCDLYSVSKFLETALLWKAKRIGGPSGEKKNGEKELSRTHCRLIELIMNIYNYPLQSQSFQWSNMWDFCFQPEIPSHPCTPSGVRTSNMSSCQHDSQHRIRWETHAGSLTCEVKEISRLDSLDPTWPCCRPFRNLLSQGSFPAPVQRCLPVCCEILIELLMTRRSDTTHEKLPRISQEEHFFLLLQNRRHREIDKSKRRGQGSNW